MIKTFRIGRRVVDVHASYIPRVILARLRDYGFTWVGSWALHLDIGSDYVIARALGCEISVVVLTRPS